jgi:phage gpG-like protein|nr:MAG TPA: virion morphogenesis protein [Caudoviricetes sp.]
MPTVDVGVLDPNVAIYAAVHEYGSSDGHTPARRWLTKGIEDNGMAVQAAMAATATAILDQRVTKAKAVDNLGADVADIVRAHVNSANFPPPLKTETVRRKGHAKAMVDSGKMMESITHRVNK